MNQYTALLEGLGLPPLPDVPPLVPPVQPRMTPAQRCQARDAQVAAQRRAERTGALDLYQLSQMPVPSVPLIAVQGLVSTPLDLRETGPWRMLSDSSTTLHGLAIAAWDGSQLTLGLWTRDAMELVIPKSSWKVARWQGSTQPDVLVAGIQAGVPIITPGLAVAQALFGEPGWAQPRSWLDLGVQLAEMNRKAGLDECAAWLSGGLASALGQSAVSEGTKDDIARWHGLQHWPGIVQRRSGDQPTTAALSVAATAALAAARVALGAAARTGTTLPTEAEDAGWRMDQAVNLRGLPFDRKMIETAVNIAHTQLPFNQAGVSTVTSKLREILDYGCEDEVVRGAYNFAAQHHGRWSASHPALHNTSRPTWNQAQLNAVWKALCNGRLSRLRKRIPSKIWERLIANLERGIFVAPEGFVFISADQKAAEPRRVFQVVGRKDVLEVMQCSDLYLDPALQKLLFNSKTPKDQQDQERRRLAIKVMVIAGSYGMGPDTLEIYTENTWGTNLSALGVTARIVIDGYRRMFPQVPRLWYRLGDASLEAWNGSAPVETPVGTFVRDGRDLRLTLPSGRPIVYVDADEIDSKKGKKGSKVICYRSGGPLTGRLATAWGGTLLNHATCGTLRDIQVAHLVQLEAEGWSPVAQTHDEIVLLVPIELAAAAMARMRQIMESVPAWAGALPLQVKQYQTERLGVEGLTR